MTLISSPMLHLAAMVAGSAAPGAPAVDSAVEAKALDQAPVVAVVTPLPATGAETAKLETLLLDDAMAAAAEQTEPAPAATDAPLLADAAADEVAGSFSRLQLAMASPDAAPTSDAPVQLELPLGDAPAAPQLAQADTPQPEAAPTDGPPADGAATEAAPPSADGPAMESVPADAPVDQALAAPVPPEEPGIDADEALIDGRRRPGVQKGLPDRITQENLGAVRPPPPEAFPVDQIPVPDRWRLVQALCPLKDSIYPGIEAVCHSPLNPYNQNFLKGDRPIDLKSKPSWLPIKGEDWFLALTGISDTVVEPRSFPTPVNRQLVNQPGALDVFGRGNSEVYAQTFLFGGSLIKGSTAFLPPFVEYRILGAYSASYVNVRERRVLDVRPSKKSHRFDNFWALQEAFVDYHIRNVSDRFDFDSVRIGIQPFQADFRGFLFNDNQLGVRFFGNRDNNRFQYNLAYFLRLEKDTNSGLNDVTQRPRRDGVFFANVYRQDFPIPGLTGQVSFTYNFNRERGRVHVDKNGFPVRPVLLGNLETRNYNVAYLGYSFDGRIGRLNLTGSAYYARGKDGNSFFTGEPAKIRAGFAAIEASYDYDWIRLRASGLYATGDGNPYDNKETGYDAIFENPIFAGADTSYFIRQTIPFAGGGRVVSLSSRNGLLFDLRSSKEEGQSNFNNPGTMLLGVGADFDLTPKIRISANASHIWFENVATLQALRQEGSIPKSFGTDLSIAAIYRPKAIQNVVFRLSGAVLDPSKGFSDLFTNSSGDDRYYSVLFNAILSF